MAPTITQWGLLVLFLLGPVFAAPAKLESGTEGGLKWQPAGQAFSDGAALPEGAIARMGRIGVPVNVHDVSRDGALVATSHGTHFVESLPYQLHIWDGKTGKHLRSIEAHKTGIFCARFSPDGAIVASGGMDNVFRLWDVKTGKQIGADMPQAGHGYSVAFSGDGKRMVTGSNNVRLWDVAKVGEIRSFTPPDRPPFEFFFHVAISPDGKTIASGSEARIRLWDADSGKQLHALKEQAIAYQYKSIFSPDNKTLIGTVGPNTILQKWNVADGSTTMTVPRGNNSFAGKMTFAANGTRMAWGALLGQYAIDLKNLVIADGDGKEIRQIDPGFFVQSFALSGEGKTLVVGGMAGGMVSFDTETGKLKTTFLQTPHPVQALRFAPTGTEIFSFHQDHSIHEWSVATKKELRRAAFPFPENYRFGQLSADGTVLVAATAEGKIRLINTSGKALPEIDAVVAISRRIHGNGGVGMPFGVQTRTIPEDPMILDLTADGGTLAALTGKGQKITVWETKTGKQLHQFPAPANVAALALVPDKKTVITISRTGTGLVQLWDRTTGKEIATKITAPEAGKNPPVSETLSQESLVVSPDGKTLVVFEEISRTVFNKGKGRMGLPPRTMYSWQLRLWDLATGKSDQKFECGPAAGVVFSSDSKRIAWTKGGGVGIHDFAAKKTVMLGSSQSAVYALAFGPKDKMLAVGNIDSTIVVWDLEKAMEKAK